MDKPLQKTEVKKCLDRWSFSTIYDFVQAFNNTYSYSSLVSDLDYILAYEIEMLIKGVSISNIKELANYISESDYVYKDIRSVRLLDKYSDNLNYYYYEEYEVICEYHNGADITEDIPLKVLLRDGYVYKVQDAGEIEHQTVQVIKHLEPELREITAPVLIPEQVDSHGDIYSHEVVHKACRDFTDRCNNPNVQHTTDNVSTDTMEFVECYITKCDMQIGDKIIKEGTWMATAKIHDLDLWEAVKQEQFTGFSVHAGALVETL